LATLKPKEVFLYQQHMHHCRKYGYCKLEERFGENFNVQLSGKYWTDIMNKGVTKGTALRTKNNTFNGMPLPSIYLQKLDGELELIKEFGYDDFKMRL